MTEEQIEHIVEREMDRLDRELLVGTLTQEEYDMEIRTLDKWANTQYSMMA